MNEFLSVSGYFSVALTVLAYLAGDFCQKKWKKPFLNPILIGTVLVILALKVLNIPTQVYREGCKLLSWLMTPATVCLAIAFYEQFQKLRHQLWAILAGVTAGCAASLGSVYLLCRLFGLDKVLMLSVLPKNITTAIGVVVSQELGASAPLPPLSSSSPAFWGTWPALPCAKPLASGMKFPRVLPSALPPTSSAPPEPPS